MAFKIIKRGMDPSEYVYRTTCKVCNTEVEGRASDYRKLHDQREHESFFSWNCPVCGQVNSLTEKVFNESRWKERNNVDPY